MELFYIDPGTGYLIIQAIIAAAASFLVFYKKARTRIINFLKKDKSNTGKN